MILHQQVLKMNSLDPASPALAVPFLRTIEWEMMDKSKFFPLSMMSSFSVRCALYPLTVVKTRLQIQRHNEAYKGMLDACVKIRKTEGMKGLYKGFWVRRTFWDFSKTSSVIHIFINVHTYFSRLVQLS